MQEMLVPTMSLIARDLHKSCALITDGRFSGASAGLSIGHVSPEAANGGEIGLIEDGDQIRIDIPARTVNLLIDQSVLDQRRATMEGKGSDAWKPAVERPRKSARHCAPTRLLPPAPTAVAYGISDREKQGGNP